MRNIKQRDNRNETEWLNKTTPIGKPVRKNNSFYMRLENIRRANMKNIILETSKTNNEQIKKPLSMYVIVRGFFPRCD